MSNVWCVTPEDLKLPDLVYVAPETGQTHSFWVRAKKRLSVGEKRKVMTAGWQGVSTSQRDGAEIKMDWMAQGFARGVAYLTDWSLTGDDGRKLPLTRDTIESLDEDVWDLIDNALTAHVERMVAEKNARTGGTGPSTISA